MAPQGYTFHSSSALDTAIISYTFLGTCHTCMREPNTTLTALMSLPRLWQIPRDVYRMMPVGFPELYTKVHPYGEIGKYLCDNVIRFNNADVGRPAGFRDLGDSPAVGVVLYDDCGESDWRPAPSFDAQMHYIHTGRNRPIKVYKNINSRFILEDFFALLQLFQQK